MILIKIQWERALWEIVGTSINAEPQYSDRQDDGTYIFDYGALIGGGTWEIQENLLYRDTTPSNKSQY